MVGFGATALNLLLIVGGYYLFGPVCAFGFGASFGIAILAAVSKLFRKGRAPRFERRISSAAISLGVVLGVQVGCYSFYQGMHQTRSRMREAKRLANELQCNSRFELVVISYHGPPQQNHERLSVGGYVSESADLESLREMVYTNRDWAVDWDVGVMSGEDE